MTPFFTTIIPAKAGIQLKLPRRNVGTIFLRILKLGPRFRGDDDIRSFHKTFGIFLLLAGCSPSLPVLKPVEVEVPVSAPCVAIPIHKPDFALAHVSVGDDLATKTKAALVEINQRRAYEILIEAQIEGCR